MVHALGSMVQSLADFVARSSWAMLSDDALGALKLRILDALGCGIAGISGEPILLLRGYVDRAGGNPSSTLIGGGLTAPDRAALYNGGAVRYLDFNDSYLAKARATTAGPIPRTGGSPRRRGGRPGRTGDEPVARRPA